MKIAQTVKHAFPPGTRAALKMRFPHLIERAAIGLDSIPIIFDVRRWLRMRNPRPMRHPLSSKMWSGFGEQVVRELEQQKFSTRGKPKVRISAAWSLAQWYAEKGDYFSALDNLLLITKEAPKLRRSTYMQLMVVECLLQLGRPEDAKRWLEWAMRGVKNPRPESYMSAANIWHALMSPTYPDPTRDSKRLEWLNKIYVETGFSQIEKQDTSAPLTLDNIAVRNPRPVDASVKLSVLMPAYNCADTLPIALTSILNQTWRNLEVLIVDDRSLDATWSVIERFARLDNRIIPLRHEQNGGAYAARNTALAHATGEFVTVHDGDDWSHPDKFAVQMLYAQAQPDGISTTVGVRVSRDLRVGVKPNTGGMIMENTSSLLLKRETLVDLGGWDTTRAAADSELYERVKAKHQLITNKLFPTTPLTLILFSGSSLTQMTAAGIATVNYGARRQYKEAYRFWHAMELASPEPNFRMSPNRRFPAPRILLKRNEPITDIDIIFVGNLADDEHSFEQHVARWETLARAGLKLGVSHWPTFRHAEANIALPVRTAIMSGLVENIVPGETVSSSTVLLFDPHLLENPPAPLPAIQAKRLFVVTENTLSPQQEETLMRFFGSAPVAFDEDYITPLLNSTGVDSLKPRVW